MVDHFNVSFLQESNELVSDHSDDDENSTSTQHQDGNSEEQCQPKKSKKRRKKITRIIKFVVDFSCVKRLKIHRKSRKQRMNDEDDETPTTSHSHYSDEKNKYPSRTPSPLIYKSFSSSPLSNYIPSPKKPLAPTPTTMELKEIKSKRQIAMTMSKKQVLGFIGMHVMLIVSLAALVLSGKACSILCTMVWLILLPLTSEYSNGRLQMRSPKIGGNNNVTKLFAF